MRRRERFSEQAAAIPERAARHALLRRSIDPHDRASRAAERGFTLLEVVVALAILGISLGVLMDAQVSSLAAAGRARNITIATLLARSKMIDIEQKLFDDGFTLGDQEENGDFNDEGHAEIKWKAKVMEVELDLARLGDLGGEAAGGAKGKKGDEGGMGADGMLAGLGAPIEGLIQGIGQNMRIVDLTVTWPDGKYKESMRVRAVETKDDLGSAAQVPGGLNTDPPIRPPGGAPPSPPGGRPP